MSKSNESWKAISEKSLKGYEVSNQGRVRNAETQTVLAPYQGRTIVFSIKGKPVCRSVAKLVATAFIGPVKKGSRVQRINKDKGFAASNLKVAE